jgi:cholinesterase
MLSPLIFTYLASLTAAQTWSIGQVVKTSSGSVKGHASSWKPDVSEYLGVPFAQPPVGSLRFVAPKPYKSDKSIDAGDFGPSCPANIDSPPNSTIVYGQGFAKTLLSVLSQSGDKYDEDCLTVNVWTKPQTGEKKKAVMVWIYGGGFNSGNSRSPSYNGARLVSLKSHKNSVQC